ncbi:hypothetical protein [Neptunomonas marina]|uniref:Uncharacterized protein n=1 Tax=Neptunomonas marina TaxID=1815562 RepID=A0A437QDR2_9GAMM|nr:hypothetical protein [Neptunomonas marina]RVU32698.1 hypothetical protein EOE65_03320 [Neptunomonas marina]
MLAIFKNDQLRFFVARASVVLLISTALLMELRFIMGYTGALDSFYWALSLFGSAFESSVVQSAVVGWYIAVVTLRYQDFIGEKKDARSATSNIFEAKCSSNECVLNCSGSDTTRLLNTYFYIPAKQWIELGFQSEAEKIVIAGNMVGQRLGLRKIGDVFRFSSEDDLVCVRALCLRAVGEISYPKRIFLPLPLKLFKDPVDPDAN